MSKNIASQKHILKRYAKALYNSASDKSDAIINDLEAIEKALSASEEFNTIINHPKLKQSERLELLLNGLKPLELQQETIGLITTLAMRNRLSLLLRLTGVYLELLDEKNGIIRVNVTTATNISAELKADIGKAFENYTKRKAILNEKLDKSIISGVKLEAGSLLLDNSLTGKLSAMYRQQIL